MTFAETSLLRRCRSAAGTDHGESLEPGEPLSLARQNAAPQVDAIRQFLASLEK